MRAAIVERYGPPEVVGVAEVPDPEPRDDEVLVRVRAVAVASGDARMRSGTFPRGFLVPGRLALGLRGPRRRVLGTAISGTVERVGGRAAGFAVGDEVAGMNGTRMGGHAELVAMRATALAHKPAGVPHPDAAGALFGGTTALHFLRDRVRPGTTALVNGAAGAVGSSAAQLAKARGGVVTAVTSGPNVAFVRRLGADHVIDYTLTPLSEVRERYDVVLDAVGNVSRELGLRLLTEDGVLVLAVAGLWDMVRARGRVVAGPASEKASDVEMLLDLLADGRLDAVTRVVGGLDDLPDAYRLVDSGHKVGNLVIEPWRSP